MRKAPESGPQAGDSLCAGRAGSEGPDAQARASSPERPSPSQIAQSVFGRVLEYSADFCLRAAGSERTEVGPFKLGSADGEFKQAAEKPAQRC